MTDIRYGLVGSGYFGRALGLALEALPGATVTTVFDPENAGPVCVELDAREASSIAELCASSDVDAVIIASPNWAHAEPVLEAARNGKHVFCEKPIALSYEECSRMIDATQASSVLFMAGHVMNFMTGVRSVKALIADGVIGDVLFSRAARTGWAQPQSEISWKNQRKLSGGHLYHHIHELDLIQSIMGPAVEVTMVGGNVAHHAPGFGDEDDLLLITLEFGNQSFAVLEYGSAFRWPEHHVLIEGTLGAIRIDLQEAHVTVRVDGTDERLLLHRTPEEDADRARVYRDGTTDGAITYGNPQSSPPLWLTGIIEEELGYFHSLMSGAAPITEFAALTDGTAATASIATADALTRSLEEKRKVFVSEITAEGTR